MGKMGQLVNDKWASSETSPRIGTLLDYTHTKTKMIRDFSKQNPTKGLKKTKGNCFTISQWEIPM